MQSYEPNSTIRVPVGVTDRRVANNIPVNKLFMKYLVYYQPKLLLLTCC